MGSLTGGVASPADVAALATATPCGGGTVEAEQGSRATSPALRSTRPFARNHAPCRPSTRTRVRSPGVTSDHPGSRADWRATGAQPERRVGAPPSNMLRRAFAHAAPVLGAPLRRTRRSGWRNWSSRPPPALPEPRSRQGGPGATPHPGGQEEGGEFALDRNERRTEMQYRRGTGGWAIRFGGEEARWPESRFRSGLGSCRGRESNPHAPIGTPD
jgi:hypothetical protein